jgi:hypothetical protein
LTMGFAYPEFGGKSSQNYHALKKVKSRSHNVRFDLFCGHSDTRLFDVAVDGCKSCGTLRLIMLAFARQQFVSNHTTQTRSHVCPAGIPVLAKIQDPWFASTSLTLQTMLSTIS